MSARLFICIPSNGRKRIVEQCLPTMVASKYEGDTIRCYNDGSREVDADFLTSLGADWAMNFSGMGVDAQRRMHILDFMERRAEFTHLYFSDSDCVMNPGWRAHLLDIHARTGLLTCGYHTQTHEDYAGNVYDRRDGIVFTRFAPGVSYLMSRAQVEVIAALLPEKMAFDWHIPSLLGYKCAVSDVSVVDHIGCGGQHDPADGSVGLEQAINPTPWLRVKRAEIIGNIGLNQNTTS